MARTFEEKINTIVYLEMSERIKNLKSFASLIQHEFPDMSLEELKNTPDKEFNELVRVIESHIIKLRKPKHKVIAEAFVKSIHQTRDQDFL